MKLRVVFGEMNTVTMTRLCRKLNSQQTKNKIARTRTQLQLNDFRGVSKVRVFFRLTKNIKAGYRSILVYVAIVAWRSEKADPANVSYT